MRRAPDASIVNYSIGYRLATQLLKKTSAYCSEWIKERSEESASCADFDGSASLDPLFYIPLNVGFKYSEVCFLHIASNIQ